MWRLFYNIVLLVVSPLIVAVLLAKRRCRPGLLQRLGIGNSLSGLSGLSRRPDQPDRPDEPDRPDRPSQPVIWIHAVSLGEVVAVTPLVNELHRRHPAYRPGGLDGDRDRAGSSGATVGRRGRPLLCAARFPLGRLPVHRTIATLSLSVRRDRTLAESLVASASAWSADRSCERPALDQVICAAAVGARAIVLSDDVADAQPLPDAVGPGRRPYRCAGSRGVASQANREYQV